MVRTVGIWVVAVGLADGGSGTDAGSFDSDDVKTNIP